MQSSSRTPTAIPRASQSCTRDTSQKCMPGFLDDFREERACRTARCLALLWPGRRARDGQSPYSRRSEGRLLRCVAGELDVVEDADGRTGPQARYPAVALTSGAPGKLPGTRWPKNRV